MPTTNRSRGGRSKLDEHYMTLIYNIKALKDKRKKLRHRMTEAEVFLWSRIKNKQLAGYKFRRQHSVGGYIVDFYCPKLKLAIELDGGYHNQEEQIIYDEERTKYLNSLNIKVVRYWNHEVLKGIDDVLEDLENKIIARQLSHEPLKGI